MRYNLKSGFTLVELSIVLVIIGLLVGGILVAQSMIETVKISSQIKQLSEFDIARRNFTERFNCIPGDCSGGFVYYSLARGLDPDGKGNGDGKLNDSSFNTPPQGTFEEPYMFFVHLSYLKIIPLDIYHQHGGYFIGKNFPLSSINKNAALTVSGNSAGDIFYFFGVTQVRDPLVYNADGSYASLSDKGMLTPEQALAIDAKLDDGKPSTGKVAAVINSPSLTPTDNYPLILETADSNCFVAATSSYNVSYSNNDACRIIVKSESY